jgi:hypothetical protein
MKIVIIILLLLASSCGKKDERCVSGKEMQLRCNAELVGDYWPAEVPEFEKQQCKNLYPGVCY